MRLRLNKSVYMPGETAVCQIESLPNNTAEIAFCLFHLDSPVFSGRTFLINQFSLDLPNRDYTGYLLLATAIDQENTAIHTTVTAIDCSSKWTKFPRYFKLL